MFQTGERVLMPISYLFMGLRLFRKKVKNEEGTRKSTCNDSLNSSIDGVTSGL